MARLTTSEVYTLETSGSADDVTVYTDSSGAAVATKEVLLAADPEGALVPTRGIVSVLLGDGTGSGSTLTLDIQGRLSDEDTFASVLAAPLDEGDSGSEIVVDVWPQMKFVLTALDADGGTGLTVRFTYLTNKPLVVTAGTLAMDRDSVEGFTL